MKSFILHFVLATFLFFSFGCDKEEAFTCLDNCIDDCLETNLKQNGMARYKGEDLGCKYFLSLYEYQNKQYFMLNNNCADIEINPADCHGNFFCKSGDPKACSRFFDKAKYIGIVGIKN